MSSFGNSINLRPINTSRRPSTEPGLSKREYPSSDNILQNAVEDEENDVFKAEGSQYPSGLEVVAIAVALALAVFCVALDNTIIATAIPKITDQFKALDDVGWYGSAYFLTTCSFQLLFGKIYKAFNVKRVFLGALFIFELGSLICGVAPNSVALIIGRAIAGLGSGGIFSGALIIIAYIVPLSKRPVYISMIGGVYGIASVAGPLMGGAFTDHATWRWCFYVNLPIGGITAIVLLIFLRLPPRKNYDHRGLKAQILQFDPLGTILFVPSIICLLLALQWGGTKFAWSNGRIIALFILFGLLLISFVASQIWLGDAATVPPRIASQRSIAFGSVFSFCLGGSLFLFIYFLPIYFQAIKGASAIHSAIDNLPLILAQSFGVVLAGALTTNFGHYMPFVVLSVILMSIGAGVITTFTVGIPTGKWIGYQILLGFGAGFGFQQTGVAAQTVLPVEDISIGTALVMFVQLLGGTIFVSVGNTVFANKLVNGVRDLHIPGFNPEIVIQAGATQLRDIVPPDALPAFLGAYNAALLEAFRVGLIMACLSALGAVGMEWRSVKQGDRGAAAPVAA